MHAVPARLLVPRQLWLRQGKYDCGMSLGFVPLYIPAPRERNGLVSFPLLSFCPSNSSLSLFPLTCCQQVFFTECPENQVFTPGVEVGGRSITSLSEAELLASVMPVVNPLFQGEERYANFKLALRRL